MKTFNNFHVYYNQTSSMFWFDGGELQKLTNVTVDQAWLAMKESEVAVLKDMAAAVKKFPRLSMVHPKELNFQLITFSNKKETLTALYTSIRELRARTAPNGTKPWKSAKIEPMSHNQAPIFKALRAAIAAHLKAEMKSDPVVGPKPTTKKAKATA